MPGLARDADDQCGLLRVDARALGDDLLHQRRLCVRDVVIGLRRPRQDVGKAGQVARPLRAMRLE